MKVCYKCKQLKTFEDFALNIKRSDGRQSMCRLCKRVDDSKYYKSNTIEHKKRVRTTLGNTKREVFNYLASHPCIDCKENDPVVLEFDHIQGDKTIGICQAVLMGWCWKRILTEIDKCVVRCANCHRRKTAKQFNHYKWLYMGVEQDGTAGGS